MINSDIPSFFVDDGEAYSKASLRPQFKSFAKVTKEEIAAEIKRIFANLDNMSDIDVIKYSQDNIADDMLSKHGFTRVDLDHIPENIIKNIADDIKNVYNNSLTVNSLYDQLKNQDPSKNQLSNIPSASDIVEIYKQIYHDDNTNPALDTKLSHTIDEILKMLRQSNFDITEYKTTSDLFDGVSDILDVLFNKKVKDTTHTYTFKECLNDDMSIQTLEALELDYYGANKLGLNVVPNPSKPTIYTGIYMFDEDTGDLYIKFADKDLNILDFEDLFEIDKAFFGFIKKWQIIPTGEEFLLSKTTDNLIDFYKTDPFSDLSSMFNLKYYSFFYNAIDDNKEEFIEEFDKLVDPNIADATDEIGKLLETQQHKKQTGNDDVETVEDVLNSLAKKANATIYSITDVNQTNVEDMLLYNKDFVSKVKLNYTWPVKMLSDDLGIEFKFKDLLKRISPDAFYPKNKAFWDELQLFKDSVINLENGECSHFREFSVLFLCHTDPTTEATYVLYLGLGAYKAPGSKKYQYRLFTHPYYNNFSIDLHIYSDADVSPGVFVEEEYAALYAGFELLTCFEYPNTIKIGDIGQCKIFATSSTLPKNTETYFDIGKIYLNDSDTAKKFKAKYGIDENVHELPICYSTSEICPGAIGNFIRALSLIDYENTEALACAPVYIVNVNNTPKLLFTELRTVANVISDDYEDNA